MSQSSTPTIARYMTKVTSGIRCLLTWSRSTRREAEASGTTTRAYLPAIQASDRAGEMRHRRDAHLAEHHASVPLHRPHADLQLGGDVLGAVAQRQQVHDLALPRRQARDAVDDARMLRRHGARLSIDLEGLADALDELLRRHRLFQKVDRPAPECPNGGRHVAVAGHHDDRQRHLPPAELLLELESALAPQ